MQRLLVYIITFVSKDLRDTDIPKRYLYSITQWGRVLEKLFVAQLFIKYPPFMEPEVLLLCSQDHVIGPYQKPV